MKIEAGTGLRYSEKKVSWSSYTCLVLEKRATDQLDAVCVPLAGQTGREESRDEENESDQDGRHQAATYRMSPTPLFRRASPRSPQGSTHTINIHSIRIVVFTSWNSG